MNIVAKYIEGVLSPEQIKNLEHVAEYASHWFYFEKGGKKPMNPRTGRSGSVDDPATAGTLQQALDAMKRFNGGGVGILVSAGVAGLVGLDTDNVIHEGELHPLGEQVIQRFAGTYIETSPSGTGLRIFCLGEIPDGTPKGSTSVKEMHYGQGIKFEAYAAGGSGRWLRMTGLSLESTRGEVAQCQESLDWFAGKMKACSASASTKADNDNDGGDVWERLEELRDVRTWEEVAKVVRGKITQSPASKLAKMVKGSEITDHSAAAQAFACEMIRLGCDHDGVIELWASPLGEGVRHHDSQGKFRERPEWVSQTIERAATAVVVELKSKKKAIDIPGAVLTKGGSLSGTFTNVVAVLRAKAPKAFAFNEFQNTVMQTDGMQFFDAKGRSKPGRLNDDDIGRVALWLGREFGMDVRDLKIIKQAVYLVAKDNRYDMVGERFKELAAKWVTNGRPEHLNTWFVKFAKVDDSGIGDYVQKVARCSLIQAVRRVLVEGAEVHAAPILIANGGDNKGHLLKALADAIGPGLYQNQGLDIGDARKVIETAGRALIVEWADMGTMADTNRFKAAMTQQFDTDRKAYGYESEDYPRKFTIWGSSNEVELISDPTLGQARRMWPLYLKKRTKIDIQGFKDVAEMVWGEAAWYALNSTERHFFDESDAVVWKQWSNVVSKCRVSCPHEEKLDGYLEKWATSDKWMKPVSSNDIARAINLVDQFTLEPKKGDFTTLTKLLTVRGLEKGQIPGSRIKAWEMPYEVRQKYLTMN